MTRHINPKEDYIFKTGETGLGKDKLASFMYAVVMCNAVVTSTFGIGIYQYTREQNARNDFNFIIKLHPKDVEKFEELSGVKLEEPIKISLNYSCNGS